VVRAIITWSLHNRLIVLLGTLGLIVAGVYSAIYLNVEAYPDPTPPLVEVITQNPGASPEEMERLVGIPLETARRFSPRLRQLAGFGLYRGIIGHIDKRSPAELLGDAPGARVFDF